MKIAKNIAVLSLSLGLVAGTTLPLAAAETGWFQQQYPPPGYGSQEYPAPYGGGLRGLVDRTQQDLRMAERQEHQKEDQRERYEHAQGHLSTFDRHLLKGHFDKGELDKAIDSMKDILDKNVLQASSREALLHDLDGLRAAREHRY